MGTQRAGGGAPGRQGPAGLCRATADGVIRQGFLTSLL